MTMTITPIRAETRGFLPCSRFPMSGRMAARGASSVPGCPPAPSWTNDSVITSRRRRKSSGAGDEKYSLSRCCCQGHTPCSDTAAAPVEAMLERGRDGNIMTMEELLAHVNGSSTDLIRIIEAASRENWPCVVVTSRAVEAWERRAPGARPTVRSYASTAREVTTTQGQFSRLALYRGERDAYVTRRC